MEKIGDTDMFLNNNYFVLMILYESKQEINNHIFASIIQQEIAYIMYCSLMEINRIIKKAGYVNTYKNSRARYQLTAKAYLLIKEMEELKGERLNEKKKITNRKHYL